MRRAMLALTVMLLAAPACAEPQNRKEVTKQLNERLGRLSNVMVEYRTKMTFPPLPPGQEAAVRPKGARHRIIRVTGVWYRRKRFMRLGEMSRYDSRITEITDIADVPDWPGPTRAEAKTYSPERSEFLTLDKDLKPISARVYDPRPLPMPEIEIALGLRAYGQTDHMSPEAIEGMAMSLPDDDRAILTCKDNEGYTHEWTFLRRHGYALSRYYRKSARARGAYYEAVMGDFKEVDGMPLPHSMTLASITPTPKGPRSNVTTEATVTAYRIGDPANTPERYRIKWPVGARVWDRRKPKTQPAATGPAATTGPSPATAATGPSPATMPAAASPGQKEHLTGQAP